MTFFCRADDIFEKSVEQSRFEQMHFEQLTLTHNCLQNLQCFLLPIYVSKTLIFKLTKCKNGEGSLRLISWEINEFGVLLVFDYVIPKM
jgi:hypothetical protein